MVTDVCVSVTIELSTEKVTVTGAFSTSPHPQLGLVTSAQISCAALAVVRGVSTLRRLRTGLTTLIWAVLPVQFCAEAVIWTVWLGRPPVDCPMTVKPLGR